MWGCLQICLVKIGGKKIMWCVLLWYSSNIMWEDFLRKESKNELSLNIKRGNSGCLSVCATSVILRGRSHIT